jgi:hypothetical protein
VFGLPSWAACKLGLPQAKLPTFRELDVLGLQRAHQVG